MFFALAKDIDPEMFTWSVFMRPTSMRLRGYNKRHNILELNKGDLIGTRQVVSGSKTGTYYLVKADAMHVVYKGLKEKTHTNIMIHCKPHKGATPEVGVIEDGFQRRQRLTNAKTKTAPNKQTSDYYRYAVKIIETESIDRNHYQWRKIKAGKTFHITTKKSGKSKDKLLSGTEVGLRFVTPAKGGYILLTNNNRIHISYEKYTELVRISRVVPNKDQRTGIIDVATKTLADQIKQTRPTKRRVRQAEQEELDPEIPIVPKYNFDSIEDEDLNVQERKRGQSKKKRLQSSLKTILKVPDLDEWEEDEEGEDYEDKGVNKDEGSPVDNEQGVSPDSDNDTDMGDDLDMGELLEEEDGEDTGEEEEDTIEDKPVVDEVAPGDVLRIIKGNDNKYVIVEMMEHERNPNLTQLFLYKQDGDEEEFTLYRTNINNSMTVAQLNKSAVIEDEPFDEAELKALQDKFDYAEIKSINLGK